MKIAVFGSGAVALYYGLLLKPLHSVKFYSESKSRTGRKSIILDSFHAHDLLIESISDFDHNSDVVIVSRKSYQLRSISFLNFVEKLQKSTLMVVLSNGMGYQSEILDLHSNTVFGITNVGVTLKDCHLDTFGNGQISFPKNEKNLIIENIFDQSLTVFSDDFEEMQHVKLVVNCCINPLTALLNCNNGELLSDVRIENLFQLIIDECCIALPFQTYTRETLLSEVVRVCESTSGNSSSMLQDYLNGRNTEIQEMNGYVADLHAKSDNRAGINSRLTSLVREQNRVDDVTDLLLKLNLLDTSSR